MRYGRLVLASLLGISLTVPLSGMAAAQPWRDARQPPDRRAAALVAQMTLDEKITELHGIQTPSTSGTCRASRGLASRRWHHQRTSRGRPR